MDNQIIGRICCKPIKWENGISMLLSNIDQLPTIQFQDFELKLEVGELNPSAREIARKELRESPEVVKEAVAALSKLLKEEDELRLPLDNEAWLIRFLRPCKYYPESARDLVKRYYNFKVKNINLYKDLTPSKEQNIFKQDILTVMGNRDQHGRRMLVIELGKKWKHNKCSLDEVFKGCVLFLEAATLEPETQVAGAVVIFDMDGLSMQQVWQFTPPFAKRIVDWLQESCPLRIKAIHIVNQPYIFNMVFSLFKPFLREKLKNRITFHGTDRNSLHQHISPKCLSPKYGGTLEIPQITGPQWLELLLKCEDEYVAINSYGYKKILNN